MSIYKVPNVDHASSSFPLARGVKAAELPVQVPTRFDLVARSSSRRVGAIGLGAAEPSPERDSD